MAQIEREMQTVFKQKCGHRYGVVQYKNYTIIGVEMLLIFLTGMKTIDRCHNLYKENGKIIFRVPVLLRYEMYWCQMEYRMIQKALENYHQEQVRHENIH